MRMGQEVSGLLNPQDHFSTILVYAINTIQIQHGKEPVMGAQSTLTGLSSETIAELIWN